MWVIMYHTCPIMHMYILYNYRVRLVNVDFSLQCTAAILYNINTPGAVFFSKGIGLQRGVQHKYRHLT